MRHCAILDIGSSKVVCMIVSSEPDGAIIVHGTGIREYSGYRLGELPNRRELAQSVSGAIHAAERAAKVTVKELTVGVPSPFMLVQKSEGAVEITSRGGRVTQADVDRLIADSLGAVPDGYSLIHSTPVSYIADKTPIKGSPLGLPCGVLSAAVSHCFADDRYKDMVSLMLERMNITVDSFVSTALAAACFTVPEELRAKNVLLVDCGGSYTEATLIEGNAIIGSGAVPIGGRHFTSDLCYGLRLPEGVAEDIKRRYVFSLDYGESCERVKIPGEGVFDIEHSFIQLIIESRAEELCELLAEKLDSMAGRETPVWLVGSGFGLMRGAKEFLETRVKRNVAVSMPTVSRNSSVSFAAAFGLADFALFRMGRTSALRRTERYLRRTFDWRS